MLGADCQRAGHRLPHGMVGGLEAEHQQRRGAVAGHRHARFARVYQTAVGRRQTRLAECAHTLGTVEEALEAHARRGAVGRPRLHADPRLGDDAEDALRAGEHPVGADAGARAGQTARLPHPRRGDRAGGLDEVLDVGQDGREVAGRARGDPAAERGELKRLGEVAQRQAVLGELASKPGPEAPAWMRAARETGSTSSTRFSALRSIETAPLYAPAPVDRPPRGAVAQPVPPPRRSRPLACSPSMSGVTPPTTDVPPP